MNTITKPPLHIQLYKSKKHERSNLNKCLHIFFTFKFTHVYKLSLLQHSLTHYLYMEQFHYSNTYCYWKKLF